MKYSVFFLAFGTLALFTGCSSTAIQGLGEVGTAALGGVAGATLGESFDDSDAGRIGGAIVGVIAAQQAAEKLSQAREQQLLEAYEQGRREARVETANEFWNQKTYADGSHPNLSGEQDTHLRQIQHDGRYIEGVHYGSTHISYDQEPRR